MRLSEFIRANVDRIVDTWEVVAGEVSAARREHRDGLRGRAGVVLRAIAGAMDGMQAPAGPAGREPKAAGEFFAASHAAEGISISDTAAELCSLRASVLKLWTGMHGDGAALDSGELIRFNQAVDQALAEAMERYMSEQEQYSRLFDTMLSSSPDLNYIFDLDGRFVYANNAFVDLYGRPLTDILGKRFDEVNPKHGGELLHNLRHSVQSKTAFRGELPCGAAAAESKIFEYLLLPVLDEHGRVEAVAGSARDVTERKASEESAKKRADFDSLTNLPNRALFRDRLEHEVRRSIRTRLPMALMFLDLDGFKEINDRYGHEAGDSLLQQCARRISARVRDTDTVARLGGDEFTVILCEVHKLPHLEVLAHDILRELARPFSIGDNEIRISASIGIALMPHDASTAQELMRNADQAMYMAKQAGRNRFCFFTTGLQNKAWARVKAIDELRRAMRRRQFSVYYQPIIDLTNGRIVKAEALLRWHHPHTGLRRAGDFIALAEETGLINDMSGWVLREALARAREWSEIRREAFQIDVNKSAVELISKASQEAWDIQIAALGRAREYIALEIAEEIILSEAPGIRERLESLRTSGIELIVHDFGVGYASLTYVKKYQVGNIKIDQALVRNVSTDQDDRDLVGAIITMAHMLGAKVIAAGVETAAQRDWLAEAGCDLAQGYLFAEPMSCLAFKRLLLANPDESALPGWPGRPNAFGGEGGGRRPPPAMRVD